MLVMLRHCPGIYLAGLRFARMSYSISTWGSRECHTVSVHEVCVNAIQYQYMEQSARSLTRSDTSSSALFIHKDRHSIEPDPAKMACHVPLPISAGFVPWPFDRQGKRYMLPHLLWSQFVMETSPLAPGSSFSVPQHYTTPVILWHYMAWVSVRH
jgi:hypothetical protein